jgi:hypothetical protein
MIGWREPKIISGFDGLIYQILCDLIRPGAVGDHHAASSLTEDQGIEAI